MICNNCKKIIPDGRNFCRFCGARITDESVNETINERKEESNQSGASNSGKGDIQSQKKYRNYKALIAVIAVLLCCAVGYIVYTNVNIQNQNTNAGTVDQKIASEPANDESVEDDAISKDTEDASQEDSYGYVKGKVLDKKNGNTIKDAIIILSNIQGKTYPEETEIKTDEYGSFTIEVPEGCYTLYITKKGFTDYSYGKNITVKSTKTTYLDSIEMISTSTTEDDKIVNTVYYILPESNTRYLTNADLDSLSEWELKLARNEIYARHGRRFKDPDLQEYFDKQSWYVGSFESDDFDKNHSSDISALEKKNAEFILQYELDHGYFI